MMDYSVNNPYLERQYEVPKMKEYQGTPRVKRERRKMVENEFCDILTSPKAKEFAIKFLNFLVIFICWIGASYQSYTVINTYIYFPTQVTVSPMARAIINMPGVTICLPTVVRRSTINQTYNAIKSKLNDIAMEPIENSEIPKYHANRQQQQKRQLYIEYENLAMSNKEPHELFLMGFNDSTFMLECKVLAPLAKANNRNLKDKIIDGWMNCTEAYTQPLESYSNVGKCFTYFSKLNAISEGEENFMIKLDQGVKSETGLVVQMKLNLSMEDYVDGSKFGNEFIMFHSSKSVSLESKKYKIQPGNQYDIYFNRNEISLMEKPYQTQCIVYNYSDLTTPQSRSDCIDRCVKNMYFNKCFCTPGHVLTRRDLAEERGSTLQLCDRTKKMHKVCFDSEKNAKCPDKCEKDCVRSYYKFDVYISPNPSKLELEEAAADVNLTKKLKENQKRVIVINIWKQSKGDMSYTHIPLLELVAMLGSVGGISGVWLGISILTIYDYIKDLVLYLLSYYFKKYQQRNINSSINDVGSEERSMNSKSRSKSRLNFPVQMNNPSSNMIVPTKRIINTSGGYYYNGPGYMFYHGNDGKRRGFGPMVTYSRKTLQNSSQLGPKLGLDSMQPDYKAMTSMSRNLPRY